jgi:alginate O-acetyltransferase complex protein AlgI
MLFNTLDFIIFFVFVLGVIALVKHRKFQHLFILIASYFFFYYTSNYLITLLIFTTLWDFYFGNLIYKSKNIRSKKLVLIVSLAGNLGLLGFFKYADFAIMQLNFLGQQFDLGTQIPLLHLILPIGISFYTFHSITYTVSIYRGQMKPVKSFTEYAIFVAFFPQLVAGPILRAYEFLPQLRENLKNSEMVSRLRLIILHNHNLKLGITIMAFGFLKKMFFADNIAPLVNDMFANPVGLDSLSIIMGTIAFGIQIYCDFSGYSDIAIGAALILGFKIPINFNKPYFATSPSDFWRRWHISLSTWLRDYLYIPLGGNKKSSNRTYINLIMVMFLGGLWHGASWNFVIWGLLHGSYLAIHKLIIDRFPNLKSNQFFKTKIGKIISITITQYFVFLAWIPFRISDFNGILYAMHKFIFLDLLYDKTLQIILANKIPVIILILFFILHFISFVKPNLREKIYNLKTGYWFIFLTSIILLILLFYDGNPENFIYFRF